METMRCRVKRSYWWTVSLGALEVAFMLVAPFFMVKELPPSSSPWPVYLICGPAALGFSYCLLHLVRSLLYEEVVTSEMGLRWRGVFGPWKSAKWEEISDFYLEKWRGSPVIKTSQGKITLSSGLANKPEMMALIAARAVNAPSRTWEMERFRAHQIVSKRFDYWTKLQKWMAPLTAVGAVLVLGILGWSAIFGDQSNSPRRYRLTWEFDLLSVAMAVVFFVPFPFTMILLSWMAWRERKRAFVHRDEWVEISPRGLIWQGAGKRIEAGWDEVRAIVPTPGGGFKRPYRVETQNGDFTVWGELENLSLWLQLARQFAPGVAPKAASSSVELGGEGALWSGQKVGEGARVFHFRTSETRAIMWGVTFLPPVLPLLPLLMGALKTPDDEPFAVPWKLCVLGLFLVVAAICHLWFCFARAAIWADENGLEWRVPLFKTRRVAWSEIESFGSDESGVFLRTRAQKRKLWQSFTPVRQNELLQLIAERATNASGKWDSI